MNAVDPKQLLVINSGSSSIRMHLYDMAQERLLLSYLIEQVGKPGARHLCHEHHDSGEARQTTFQSDVPNHAAGLEQLFSFLERRNHPIKMLYAVGHRVVHGGEQFRSATIVDSRVMNAIRAMSALAPLHNPANLAGIEAVQSLCPGLPQVAVFDTAFFSSLPAYARRFALPEDLYRQQHVRRYGFHGISHQSVAMEAARYLQESVKDLRIISLHLGNGASAAAIKGGICVDTSMGMTPLDGLMMGTRCGDLDPSVLLYLARVKDMNIDEIEAMLNNDSGLKGICGASDMREVQRLASAGDENAQLAIEMYCYRVSKYIGAYHAILGGVDALVFTAGIGENSPLIRAKVCSTLRILGFQLDQRRNQNVGKGPSLISSDASRCKIAVVPSNEALEIARQTIAALAALEG